MQKPHTIISAKSTLCEREVGAFSLTVADHHVCSECMLLLCTHNLLTLLSCMCDLECFAQPFAELHDWCHCNSPAYLIQLVTRQINSEQMNRDGKILIILLQNLSCEEFMHCFATVHLRDSLHNYLPHPRDLQVPYAMLASSHRFICMDLRPGQFHPHLGQHAT